ncbi:sulfur carrier protein ThiS [Niveibacterium terrae]|uniref:sulfur carrier protein ThiS n=1 Tax=Niveibacterium terrae TaxID=3373598 RepID=UPI003A932FAC
MIELTVNGAAHTLPETTSLAELLGQLGFSGKRIAVERNGLIVPRGRHADERLAHGDQIEIVVAVGGG